MELETLFPGNQVAMETREQEVESPSIFDLNYVLSSCSNFSPDLEEEERASKPTLNLLDVNYEVKERVGPWWKGACFRKQRKKSVLRDVTMQLKSGLLTAILGSSGSLDFECFPALLNEMHLAFTGIPNFPRFTRYV